MHLYVLRCWVYVSVYFGFDRKTYTDGTFGHPLTDAKCEAAKARESDYTLFDGQGLHLLVKTNGKKVWRFKYSRPDGRAGLATFGSYPALSLKAARNRRAEARELLAHGIDPIENAKQSKVEADRARRNTFEAVARDWHAISARKWKSDHADTVLRRLETHLFPRLGSRPVAELKTRDLLEPLRELERKGIVETASRLANTRLASCVWPCKPDILSPIQLST